MSDEPLPLGPIEPGERQAWHPSPAWQPPMAEPPCPHDDYVSRSIGSNLWRHACVDCGEVWVGEFGE